MIPEQMTAKSKGGKYMEFSKLAQERYSVRKFDSKPVEKEKLEMVLNAGKVAPTAHNNQPQRLLVIESEEALEKLKGCTNLHFGAPMAVLVCYDKNVCWERSFDNADSGQIDASIITTHMMMQAADIGLGTTWVMHFDPSLMIKAFSLPDNFVPVALLPIGYPAADAAPSPMHEKRVPIDETVFYNKFPDLSGGQD